MKNARFGISQQARQSCLAFEKPELTQIVAIILDKVKA
jgi:hypothetical protein